MNSQSPKAAQWRLVPVMPTDEMCDAALAIRKGNGVFHIYQAMLEAAPAAPEPAEHQSATAYIECRECSECNHIGINDSHDTDAACGYLDSDNCLGRRIDSGFLLPS
jgi:hypothetical protein